ncbi:MAG: 1-deoxy-D-xylulose-5-phosphate reductoisomerase [Candidatus Omnitrophica bacterium]|nr:1-deoxy-D-xylulose-5-phosphate reductoisomerase [Candidatus Omnitrophota bacterium]
MKNSKKQIILLGSTGSVGRNVLDVVRKYPEQFHIKAIASFNNVELLVEQAEEFSPEMVTIGNVALYSEIKSRLKGKVKIYAGMKALEEMATEPCDTVFMAIGGVVALKPLVAAIGAGRRIALASKEPIVSAGEIIRNLADKKRSVILPVDSEHSAIMECLLGKTKESLETIYITGSGGALWKVCDKSMGSVTVNDVLRHPKWKMGRKITVDSATLMNKGLEVIEARWLFDVKSEKIKIVIHPEAIIHSLVEFVDGTMRAVLFYPDMRFPILKALSFPEVLPNDFQKVDLFSIGNFSFFAPDVKKFPAVNLAYYVLDKGGTTPAVLNAANETSVNLFLTGKIKFLDIIDTVAKVVHKHKSIKKPSLDDIINAEEWAKGEVLKLW